MRRLGRFFRASIVLLLVSCLACGYARAQDPNNDPSAPIPAKTPPPKVTKPALAPSVTPTPDEMAKLPKRGVIASTASGDFGAVGNSTWENTDLSGDSKPPISASVSKIGADSWKLRVFNNGKDAYSFTVRVAQKAASGSGTKSDSFTFSLKPGEKAERVVPTGSGTTDVQVILESFKRIKSRGKPATSPTPQPVAGGSASTKGKSAPTPAYNKMR